MPGPLFRASSFPLSAAGSVAQALSDSGDLAQAGQGIGDAISAYKTHQMLNTKLSDLGFDDQHALLAGAAPMPQPDTAIPGGSPTGNGLPLVLPPSAMTVKQLLMRKQAAGAQADQATAPNVAQVFGGADQMPPQLGAFGNVPVPTAEKMAPLMKATNQKAAGPQWFADSKALDAFYQGGPLPTFSASPTGNPDEHQLDNNQYKAMLQLHTSRRLDDAAATPEDRKLVAGAVQAGNVDVGLTQTLMRTPGGVKTLASIIKANPTKSITQDMIATAAAKAAGTTTARTKADIGVRLDLTGGTMDQIGAQLGPKLASLDASSFKPINEAFRNGEAALNDPAQNEVLSLLNDLAYQKAAQNKAAGGGKSSPTDADVKAVKKTMSAGTDASALTGLMSAIKFETGARRASLNAAGGSGPQASAGGGYTYKTGVDGSQIRWKPGMKAWEPVP